MTDMHPLMEGMILTLPPVHDGGAFDAEKRAQWLRTMAANLDLLYGPERLAIEAVDRVSDGAVALLSDIIADMKRQRDEAEREARAEAEAARPMSDEFDEFLYEYARHNPTITVVDQGQPGGDQSATVTGHIGDDGDLVVDSIETAEPDSEPEPEEASSANDADEKSVVNWTDELRMQLVRLSDRGLRLKDIAAELGLRIGQVSGQLSYIRGNKELDKYRNMAKAAAADEETQESEPAADDTDDEGEDEAEEAESADAAPEPPPAPKPKPTGKPFNFGRRDLAGKDPAPRPAPVITSGPARPFEDTDESRHRLVVGRAQGVPLGELAEELGGDVHQLMGLHRRLMQLRRWAALDEATRKETAPAG